MQGGDKLLGNWEDTGDVGLAFIISAAVLDKNMTVSDAVIFMVSR